MKHIQTRQFKRGTRYRARVSVDGIQHTGPYRDTPQEAKADLPKLRIETGALPKSTETLGGALETILARRSVTAQPPSQRLYQRQIRAILSVIRPEAQIRQIQAKHINTAYAQLLETYHVNTLIKLQTFIRAAFKENDVPWPRGVTKLRRIEPEMPYLKADEVRDLLEKAYAKYPEAALFMDVIAHTGARLGELARIEPKDVDLDRSTITLRSNKGKKQARKLPLPPHLNRRLSTRVRATDNRLLLGEETQIASKIYYALDMLGMDHLKGGRSFRHSFITALHVHGKLDVRTAMQMADHKRLETHMRYLHGDEERHEEASQKVAQAFAPRGFTNTSSSRTKPRTSP